MMGLIVRTGYTTIRLVFGSSAASAIVLCCMISPSRAVLIADNTPTGQFVDGTSGPQANGFVNDINAFVGVVTGTHTTGTEPVINTPSGTNVELGIGTNGTPFQPGQDVAVRRTCNATSGCDPMGWQYVGSTWTYDVNAVAGLLDIRFDGEVYYRSGGHESSDSLTFDLFLNSSSVAADSITVDGLGDDGQAESTPIVLTHTGSASITSAQVRVSFGGFATSGEGFLTRGRLSANAIPEPSAFWFMGFASFLASLGSLSLGVGGSRRHVPDGAMDLTASQRTSAGVAAVAHNVFDGT